MAQRLGQRGQRLDAEPGGVRPAGSGIVFALTSGEASQLNATMLANAGNEVFTVGATFANAQGGPETIAAIRLVSAIPEPETYVLMLAGIGAIGFVARRRGQKG